MTTCGTITPMHKPTWLDRIRHQTAARLAPRQWRAVHRVYARLRGTFWQDCHQCGQPFGGHEIGRYIIDITRPDCGTVECSDCSRAKGGIAS